MPAAMHSYYLRNMYMKNLLVEPGGSPSRKRRSTSRRSSVPTYFVSAIEDHIAPWKTTYRHAGAGRQVALRAVGLGAHRRHGEPAVRPTSTASGPTRTCPPPDAWFAGATQNEGSWWPTGGKWVSHYLGEVPRVPGKGKLKVLEAAPGTYAHPRRRK